MKKMIINVTMLIIVVLAACFIAGIGCLSVGLIIDAVINHDGVFRGFLEYACAYYYDDRAIMMILSLTALGSFMMAKLLVKFVIIDLVKRLPSLYKRMRLGRQIKWLV